VAHIIANLKSIESYLWILFSKIEHNIVANASF
jgi:hypothetical protein